MYNVEVTYFSIDPKDWTMESKTFHFVSLTNAQIFAKICMSCLDVTNVDIIDFCTGEVLDYED